MMDIKKNFNSLINFFLNKKDQLIKPDSIDIVFIYNDVVIGVAQSLSWKHDGKLWISRARFDKQRLGEIFKNGVPSKNSQLKPFNIVIRASNLPEVVLHELQIINSSYLYTSQDWMIGEDIYLSLPTKVSLNDSSE